VHKYLSSIHTEVRATRTDINSLRSKVADCGESKIRKVVKDAVQESLGPALQPYSSLADSLNLMATALRSGLQVPTATAMLVPPPNSKESPSAEAEASPMEEDDNDGASTSTPSLAPPLLRDIIGSHPKPTYVSIHKLYDEFYGLGGFEGNLLLVDLPSWKNFSRPSGGKAIQADKRRNGVD
jgi:hypothetical protein